jgi:hypothetical protein
MTAQPQKSVHRPIRLSLANPGELGNFVVVAKMCASDPDNGTSAEVDMSEVMTLGRGGTRT